MSGVTALRHSTGQAGLHVSKPTRDFLPNPEIPDLTKVGAHYFFQEQPVASGLVIHERSIEGRRGQALELQDRLIGRDFSQWVIEESRLGTTGLLQQSPAPNPFEKQSHGVSVGKP